MTTYRIEPSNIPSRLDICRVCYTAFAQGNARHAAPWPRPVALPTLPGAFRALKLRAGVAKPCDWSTLRKAALDITLGCRLVDVTRSPTCQPTARADQKGAMFSRSRLEAGPAVNLLSLTPQQLSSCGIARCCMGRVSSGWSASSNKVGCLSRARARHLQLGSVGDTSDVLRFLRYSYRSSED